MSLQFQNPDLEALHDPGNCDADRFRHLVLALKRHRVLEMTSLATGLYPASSSEIAGVSGYQHVWTRDNVYVGIAKLEAGDTEASAAIARALLAFYHRYRSRFDATAADAREATRRPHVRFDGVRLEELGGERWAHAQNDAIGYCLWLCARLVRQRVLLPSDDHLETMARMVHYLVGLEFWNDEDSGHWEEGRKRSASSIGTVAAGLREWVAMVEDAGRAVALSMSLTKTDAEVGLRRGLEALGGILPSECVQPDPGKQRRYDAALIFLVHPLEIVGGAMAAQILANVEAQLTGVLGIRRYPGDSYWAPDYDTRLAATDWTRDYSADIETRNRLVQRAGDEAQWCIFDPILSAYHGHRYLISADEADHCRQVHHFDRALAQVTKNWQCPELYYLKAGRFVPNPHTPLLWTQANLQLAVTALQRTVATRR